MFEIFIIVLSCAGVWALIYPIIIKDIYKLKSHKQMFIGCVTNKQFKDILVKVFTADDFKEQYGETVSGAGYTIDFSDSICDFNINKVHEFSIYQKHLAYRLYNRIRKIDRQKKIKEKLGL